MENKITEPGIRQKRWEEKFQEFVEFRKNNPNRMPNNNHYDESTLFMWCYWQNNYENHLSAEQKNKLNQAGFQWNWREQYRNQKWDNMCMQFLELKKKNPGMSQKKLFSAAPNTLNTWCKLNQKTWSKLSQDKIDKLKAAGFEL